MLMRLRLEAIGTVPPPLPKVLDKRDVYGPEPTSAPVVADLQCRAPSRSTHCAPSPRIVQPMHTYPRLAPKLASAATLDREFQCVADVVHMRRGHGL